MLVSIADSFAVLFAVLKQPLKAAKSAHFLRFSSKFWLWFAAANPCKSLIFNVERNTGVEPASSAWENLR